MAVNEREEEVAHREAEHAVGADRRQAPPVSDEPVESPVVERRPADLEQTPSPRED